MTSFGQINEFDASIEAWTLYTERLEQFFVANAIDNAERRRAIFLTVVGPATYALLRNLLSPAAPNTKTLQEIIDVLNGHFDPAPSIIVERYKFNSRVRRAGESVADFIAELRSLAKYCNYGTSLDEMLRDRIVCGIQEEGIQRKLLAESALTLAKATEIAVTMETAARDANNLRMTSGGEVNKVFAEKGKKKYGKSSSNARFPTKKEDYKECNRCGDKHQPQQCRFKDSTCFFCKKIGHIAKVCRARRKTQDSRLNNLQIEKQEDHCEKSYMLCSMLNHEKALPPFKVECSIQGKSFVFEVDSGAPFAVMPAQVFEPVKEFFPPLEPTEIKLTSFTQHSIDVLGLVHVQVSCDTRSRMLPLIIVKQGTINLAGRNWIAPLHLMSAFEKTDLAYAVNNVPIPRKAVDNLFTTFADLFSSDLGVIKDVKVHFVKKEAAAKFFKARPVPYALKDKVDGEILRLEEAGILEKVKNAESAAPIVPVLKRDGRVRICGDFKLTTNKVTELEQYPLPNIEDLFAQLSGGKVFSKLDLRDAYCQLQLDEESKNLVVINTHKGLFRYTVLPFGVASAPAVFQREMDKILQGLKAACYLDDVLVYGRNEAEHWQNLNAVLTRLQESGMKFNPDKCEFFKTSVEYLGHKIDSKGLHPIDSKTEAIAKAPSPRNVEELRSFIGLITYYAKFLPNMATVLAPLYELLKSKVVWNWSTKQEEAFKKVKEALQSSAVLMHFDNDKEVILACDASPYGLGAVLSHQTSDGDRPIAFASRSLTSAEKNYSHIEKEALSLVFGVTKFRKYLLGRTFTLLTDHRPLENLLSEDKPVPAVAAARIQRWALTLSAYSYKIRYRKGSLHANADACSRLPLSCKKEEPFVPTESVLLLQQLDDSPVTKHLIAAEIEKCPDLRLLKSVIMNGFRKKVDLSLQPFLQVKDELSIEEGIILRGSRVYIPPKFRSYIIHELHSAHQGMTAIKALARSYVWWPGIDGELETAVKSCLNCQQNATAPPAKHVPWTTPEHAWDRVHIDHAGPVEGRMLLIVVDAKSKWLEVEIVPSTSSPATIEVLRSMFARFGLPKTLVSDNGPGFRSDEFSKFLRDNGITPVKTPPYHPQSNGLAERAVRTVKAGLKKVTEGAFTQRLARFLFYYRMTPSASTGVSPAVAMFGRPLRTRLDLIREPNNHFPEKERNSKYSEGTPVWVRSYGHGPAWVPGSVLRQVGKVMCKVKTPSGNCTRHFDQLRSRLEGENCEVPPPSEMSAPSVPPVDSVPEVPANRNAEPPVLSPQVSTDLGTSSEMSPPVLTPQVVSETPSVPQVRRSQRVRFKPKRLRL